MTNNLNTDKLERFYQLQSMKKEMEAELEELKREFHAYFDATAGENRAGELAHGGYLLKRQVRKTEKYDEKRTVERLEELKMEDLIETVRRPDKTKIHAAVELGLLRREDIEDLVVRTYTKAISVKKE